MTPQYKTGKIDKQHSKESVFSFLKKSFPKCELNFPSMIDSIDSISSVEQSLFDIEEFETKVTMYK